MGFRPFVISKSKPYGCRRRLSGLGEVCSWGFRLRTINSDPEERKARIWYICPLSLDCVQIFFFLLVSVIVLWSVVFGTLVVMSIWLGLIRTVMNRSFSALGFRWWTSLWATCFVFDYSDCGRKIKHDPTSWKWPSYSCLSLGNYNLCWDLSAEFWTSFLFLHLQSSPLPDNIYVEINIMLNSLLREQ